MTSSPLSSTGTAPSSTSCARSGSDLLAARDRRDRLLWEILAGGPPMAVTMTLNLPGADKGRPGTAGLFLWGRGRLAAALPQLHPRRAGIDLLGPFLFLAGAGSAPVVKRACIRLEESSPAARLLDLDVYLPGGRVIDRAALGIPRRSCLLCSGAAVDCGRLRRHPPESLLERVDALLRPFVP